MIESPTPETKWYWPQALADRADDGFLSVVRSTGKALGGLSSGTVRSFSRIGQVLVGTERKTPKQQTEPADAGSPPRQLDREMEPPEPQRPPLDAAALLDQHSPQDGRQAAMLRKALDDLLHGSEEVRRSGLETLVGLGRRAEPLLVACLQTDTPQVAECALEGLSRIGSQRFAGCISDLLQSSDSEFRLAALRATQRLPEEQQQQPLLGRGLRDPSARVRRRALGYLSRHDSYWAVAEALRLYDDQDPDVQWAAVEAMIALRPSEAHSILELVMPSLDPAYQRRAAVLLGQGKDQRTLSEKKQDTDTRCFQGRRMDG